MRRLNLICAAAFGFFQCAYGSPIKVACIGDSITAGFRISNPSVFGYPGRLQRLLGTNYIVRNFGLGGRTLLEQGDYPYSNEPAFAESHDFSPDIVIIQLGTNDSKPQNWQYGTNFVADYEEFVASYAGLSNAPAVYICTPCPVYGNGGYDIRPDSVETQIAPFVRDISLRLSLPLIDLNYRLAGHNEWFPDNVHPNSKGMTVMAAIIFGALRSDLAEKPLPVLSIRTLSSASVAVSWPAEWGNLAPQISSGLTGTNNAWLIFEGGPASCDDQGMLALTNTFGPSPQFFRLWQP